MPKSITTYYCDICGAGHRNNPDAVACEKKHKIVDSATAPEYDKNDKKNQYPSSVNIIFKDGTSARYYRKI